MTKEIQKQAEIWDYRENVEIGKKLVRSSNDAFLKLVRVLYKAREALSASGTRTDLTSGQPVPRLILPTETTSGNVARGSQTWEQFCKEIGISKRTANRYFMDYLPDQDRLMTEEEKEQRRGELLIGLFKAIEDHKAKGEKDWRPYPWNESLERKYHKWLDSLSVIKSIEDDAQQQAELFSREYLNLLARQLEDDPTPEEMLYEHTLIERYKNVITPAVPARDQISIVRMAEKAVGLFAPPARADVARSVAKVLMDLADKMEG